MLQRLPTFNFLRCHTRIYSLFFALLVSFLLTGALSISCMDHPQVPKNAGTLYELWGISPAKLLPKDMKNALAALITPKTGWWYPEQVLPHRCTVSALHFDAQNQLLHTADTKARLRMWKVPSLCGEMSEQKQQANNLSAQTSCALLPNHEVISENTLGTLNDIAVNGSLSSVKVFDGGVMVHGSQSSNNTFFKSRFGNTHKKVFLHPNQDYILALSTEKMHFMRHTQDLIQQRNTITCYSMHAQETLDEYFTLPFICSLNTPFDGCVGDMHPSGTCFALAEGGGFTPVALDNGTLMEDPSVCSRGMEHITALQFSPCGKHLASGRFDGSIEMFSVDNACQFSRLHFCQPLSNGIVQSIKFHPHEGAYFAAVNESVYKCSLTGEKLCRLSNAGGMVNQVVVHPSGDMLMHSICLPLGPRIKTDAVVIWKRFDKPTFDQLLMRMTLNKYMQACTRAGIDPETKDVTSINIVSWMGQRFNLQKKGLKATWDSLPCALQTSIIRTLIRAGKSAHAKEQKHHA